MKNQYRKRGIGVAFLVHIISIPICLTQLVYLVFFPLDRKLKTRIRELQFDSINRKYKLNEARISRIPTVLWANSGTILGFLIAIFSIVYSIIDHKGGPNESDWVRSLLVLLIPLVLTIVVAPIFVDQMLHYLAPQQYAEACLIGLGESNTLSITAFEMLSLCRLFEKKMVKRKSHVDVMETYRIKNHNSTFSLRELKKSLVGLRNEAESFLVKHEELIDKCNALKELASRQLHIRERELCHHILKFTPSVFKVRLNRFINEIVRMERWLERNDFAANPQFQQTFQQLKQSLDHIYSDIVEKHANYLEQIVIHSDLHQYLVGISSGTSTSHAFWFFVTGIAKITKLMEDRNHNPKMRLIIYSKLRCLLGRSKAHFGMDLLILVENYFYHRPESCSQFRMEGKDIDISQLLWCVKHNRYLGTVEENFDGPQILSDNSIPLGGIQAFFFDEYEKGMEIVSANFRKALKKLGSKSSENKYICLFGYSRVVIRCIEKHAELLRRYNIRVFVIKDEEPEMLDTRVFRFELQDGAPEQKIDTFTASDALFLNLINDEDSVVFLAGAEVYDKANRKLFHTNNYQDRVSDLIAQLQKRNLKLEVWVAAGDYKRCLYT